MQNKYKVKQTYPGLKFEVGTILFRHSPIVGFSYYSDINDKHRIEAYLVEQHPEFFEKI